MEEENIISEIASQIADCYSDGTLIKHEWLKKKCGYKLPEFSDYDNVADFLEAVNLQQFAYMGFVDAIRTELIKNWSMWLKNERGIGYVIVSPNDQVSFGYDRFADGLKKLIKETNLIMTNVQGVSREQQAKDNDLRAKYASMKAMLESIKN